MKTILVDAINAFIDKETGVFQEMYELLETYPNKKIILTGANDEQIKQFGLDDMPYELFTLKHNPEKSEPEYYKLMLEHFGLTADDVVYFEHNVDAKKSAESIGILTYLYDKDTKDLENLKIFLDQSLESQIKA
jgi:HAD superfamily hydrolase (TIGR01509 family)